MVVSRGCIGVLDLAGDLKLRCAGTGRVQKQETENGTVYRCACRKGGEVMLLDATACSAALLPTTRRGCRPGRAAPGTAASSSAASASPAR